MAESGLITAAAPAARDAFLAELGDAVERAFATAAGAERRDFLIAGLRLRIEFAAASLIEPLTAALDHARVEPDGRPDLVVSAWDQAATGVAIPRPGWEGGPRDAGAVRAYTAPGLRVLHQDYSDTVSVFEPGSGRGCFWVADGDALPFFERAAPLCKLLHLWLAERGLHLAHAAAVAGEAGCVMLAGPARAGKSSTALACIGAPGLAHLADDYCVLDTSAARPVLHPLYSSIKVNPDTLERLAIDPAIVANPVRGEGEKAIIFLARHRPEVLGGAAPLAAIALPEVSGRPGTRARDAAPGAALAALAPSTMLQLPGTGAATMAALAAAVRAAPCHRVEVGTDPADVAPVIAAMVG